MDPTARMRPMDSTARRRPMDRTARRRPMDPTARRRPMDPKARIEGGWILRPGEGPWIIQPAGGPWLQQFVCCHDYFGLVTKNRLLWPLEKKQKKNYSDYKETTKQDNKEINKQAINASLLPLLHILHPLGIEVHHQCKYREQSSTLHTLAVKIGHQCK